MSNERVKALLGRAIKALETASCQFWACDGPEAPVVAMKTCNVCASIQELRDELERMPS